MTCYTKTKVTTRWSAYVHDLLSSTERWKSSMWNSIRWC